jgi:hypothetical protein
MEPLLIRSQSQYRQVNQAHRKVIVEVDNLNLVSAFRVFRCIRMVREGTINKLKDQNRLTRDCISSSMTKFGSLKSLLLDAVEEYTSKRTLGPTPIPTTSPSFSNMISQEAIANGMKGIRNLSSTSISSMDSFNKGDVGLIRTTRSIDLELHHIRVRSDERFQCALCCSLCVNYWKNLEVSRESVNSDTHSSKLSLHSRRGYQATTYCSTCNVSLCDVEREDLFNAKISCFEAWHNIKELKHPFIITLTPSYAEPLGRDYTNSSKKRRKESDVNQNFHKDIIPFPSLVPRNEEEEE